MYKLLLEDEEFKMLDLPQSEENHELLEQLIREDICHEPVFVWQDRIIDGYERYGLYQKYHRAYSVTEEYIPGRDMVIAWICQQQLRRKDLTTNAEAWLLYRLFSVKSKLGKQSAGGDKLSLMLSKTEVQDQICREYHISEASLRRYVFFGKQLDILEDSFPGTRRRILTGQLKVAREHMKALLAMPETELCAMINDPECQRLIPQKASKSPRRKVRIRMLTTKPEPHTGIKQMPAYDPDAELNGLTFTMGSWEKAVSRVRQIADLQAATPTGKQRLKQAITGLMTEVGELNRRLEA